LHLPFGVHAEIACIKTRQFLIQEFFYFWISKKGSKTNQVYAFAGRFYTRSVSEDPYQVTTRGSTTGNTGLDRGITARLPPRELAHTVLLTPIGP